MGLFSLGGRPDFNPHRHELWVRRNCDEGGEDQMNRLTDDAGVQNILRNDGISPRCH